MLIEGRGSPSSVLPTVSSGIEMTRSPSSDSKVTASVNTPPVVTISPTLPPVVPGAEPVDP